MEETIKEIRESANGARFKRADLHIHSFGPDGSADVTDNSLTPEGIVDTAIAESIEIISITDHNKIGNSDKAIQYSKDKPILVIPGIELSTPQGHLLVYFPSYDLLKRFIGKLDFSEDYSHCKQTIVECLNTAKSYDGLGIAAHIDSPSGFELYVEGYKPSKEEILKCQNLMALEISRIENQSWYTDEDINDNRKRLWKSCKTSTGEDDFYCLGKIMSSDAHTLNSLGLNAAGNKKLTRLKMDELSFSAFKIALLDPSARVRLEEQIPQSVPYFEGMKLSGGLLDKQVVKFSKNLTCIIGGRGAGKSTLLEALRATSGNIARENLLDSEVWPDLSVLIYKDEVGIVQILRKDKLCEVSNVSNPEEGPTKIEIESYGQGETAETIQHSDKEPKILLDFLDNFIDFGTLENDDEEIKELLLENQTNIERRKIEVSSIPEVKKAKANAEAQLKTLKEQKASEIVELEEKLAKERQFKENLIAKLNALLTSAKSCFSDRSLIEEVAKLDESSLVIGKEEFNRVKSIIEELGASIDKMSVDIHKVVDNTVQAIKKELNEWKIKETEAFSKIDAIRKSLEEQGIILDISFIRKITKDVADYTTKLANLLQKEKELKEIYKERTKMIMQRHKVKAEIFNQRYKLAEYLNKNLKDTATEYYVDISYKQGKLAPGVSKIIKEAMGWRTSQVPKADLIANNIALPDLLKSIQTSDTKLLEKIIDNVGAKVFSKADVKYIIDLLREEKWLFLLERSSYDDYPVITVTKKMVVEGAEPKYIPRDFTKLSLGQQQAILLTILLYSKNNCPLIIDQPEDNLDGEFIYKTFVRNLRYVKERRQVIIVTHNPNIAVLGDAELIIPLKSTSNKTFIVDKGSIDNAVTKKITCSILEGSELAFKMRQRIYGY